MIFWPPAPLVPVRGELADRVDFVVTVITVTSVVMLGLFVIDAIRLGLLFTRTLSGASCTWPATDYATRIAKARGVGLEQLGNFLLVLVIGRQTRVLCTLLSYPFMVLFLMVFAQYGTFDTWRWPLLFVTLIAALAATVLGNGVVLIQAARKARERCLRQMREVVANLRRLGQDGEAGAHDMLVEDARAVREGAFSGFGDNPVVKAVLLPSGGLGALSLLDLLNRAFS